MDYARNIESMSAKIIDSQHIISSSQHNPPFNPNSRKEILAKHSWVGEIFKKKIGAKDFLLVF
jgi:hypothetical protein